MEDKKIEYKMNYNNFINIFADILLRNQDLFKEAIAENAVAILLFIIYFIFVRPYNIKNNKRRN